MIFFSSLCRRSIFIQTEDANCQFDRGQNLLVYTSGLCRIIFRRSSSHRDLHFYLFSLLYSIEQKWKIFKRLRCSVVDLMDSTKDKFEDSSGANLLIDGYKRRKNSPNDIIVGKQWKIFCYIDSLAVSLSHIVDQWPLNHLLIKFLRFRMRHGQNKWHTH